MLGQHLHGKADDHDEQACHQRHGADDRQGNDYPHSPGSAVIRAHLSTIASQNVHRKPYDQVLQVKNVTQRTRAASNGWLHSKHANRDALRERGHPGTAQYRQPVTVCA